MTEAVEAEERLAGVEVLLDRGFACRQVSEVDPCGFVYRLVDLQVHPCSPVC